jgi:predicted DNA-binding transcriptional regulator AlpA
MALLFRGFTMNAAFLDGDDLCEFVGIPRKQLWPLIRAGKLPPPTLTINRKRLRWSRAAVDRFFHITG